MSSKIEIINRALRALAEQPINALDEGSEPANVMSDIYDIELAMEIRSYPYTWAQKTAELAEITSEDPPDYGYVFQLPADYCNIIEIVDLTTSASIYTFDSANTFLNPRYQEWEIREGKLYINSSSVYIKYTAIETDTSKWDANFVMAFVYRLAMTAGPAITEKMALIDRAERLYMVNATKARAYSKGEQRRRSRLSEDYLNARNA